MDAAAIDTDAANEREIMDKIANEHAADWENTVDGMYRENVLPTPPRTPWPSLEAAMREMEYVALLAVAVTPSERYAARGDDVTRTARPMVRAS